LTPGEQQFNKAMSQVRVSVEWLFGDFVNYFAFLDFKDNLKIGLSPDGKMYIACALLRNAHSCLYQPSTSRFFGIDPPESQDHFNQVSEDRRQMQSSYQDKDKITIT